jgi:primary-amine oxidase
MPGVDFEIPHPFDPLSLAEIETAISTVKKAHGDVFFNVVALHEPRKAEMTAWLADPTGARRPKRIADVVVIAPGGKVYDALVALDEPRITKWEELDGVQPIVSKRTLLQVSEDDTDANQVEPGDRSPWRSSRSWSTSAERTPR